MDLAYTTSPTMAQCLARIELLKIRQQIAVQIRCKLPALKIRPGDVVNLTNTRLGWSAKPFEVLEWSLTYDADQLGVALGLRETASAIYDWNTGIELPYDIAPDTNLPNPFTLAAPTSISAEGGSARAIDPRRRHRYFQNSRHFGFIPITPLFRATNCRGNKMGPLTGMKSSP